MSQTTQEAIGLPQVVARPRGGAGRAAPGPGGCPSRAGVNRRHWLLAGWALATGGIAAPPTPAQREAKARAYFTDTVLLRQDGRPVRFYSDVLKDRVVLVNFVFTECGDSCPLITHKLLQARQALGPAAAQVRYVSITIDPLRDTPQTLSQFAARHGAVDPEWLWLSGTVANVERVTKKLGAYTDERSNHFTGLIVGNLRTDRWVKIRPDAPPNAIALQLRTVGELDVPGQTAP